MRKMIYGDEFNKIIKHFYRGVHRLLLFFFTKL